MRLIRVTWFDAHDVAEAWCQPAQIDADERRIVVTVGHEVPDVKPGHLVVALSKDHEGNIGGGIAIPSVNVLEVVELSALSSR